MAEEKSQDAVATADAAGSVAWMWVRLDSDFMRAGWVCYVCRYGCVYSIRAGGGATRLSRRGFICQRGFGKQDRAENAAQPPCQRSEEDEKAGSKQSRKPSEGSCGRD